MELRGTVLGYKELQADGKFEKIRYITLNKMYLYLPKLATFHSEMFQFSVQRRHLVWSVYTWAVTGTPNSYTPEYLNSFRNVTRKLQNRNMIRHTVDSITFFLIPLPNFNKIWPRSVHNWGDHTCRRCRWQVASVDCLVTFMKGRLVSRAFKNFGVNNDMNCRKSQPYPRCRQETGKGSCQGLRGYLLLALP